METTNEVAGESKGSAVFLEKTLEYPVKVVWDVLMTEEGAETLLGPGAKFGSKGQTWESLDGREGVIRSFHPLEEIRFSWRLNQDSSPSMVEVSLNPITADGKDHTCLKISHTNLSENDRPERIKERWQAALERIESDCL